MSGNGSRCFGDVNESEYEFAVNEKGQIRFGLGDKRIGEGHLKLFVRKEKGEIYRYLYLFERIPSSQLNKSSGKLGVCRSF
jgi:DNA polymerase-3 subunit alpha